MQFYRAVLCFFLIKSVAAEIAAVGRHINAGLLRQAILRLCNGDPRGLAVADFYYFTLIDWALP